LHEAQPEEAFIVLDELLTGATELPGETVAVIGFVSSNPGERLDKVLLGKIGAGFVDEKSESFHRITKCDAKMCIGAVLSGVRVGQASDSTAVVLKPSRYGHGNVESVNA
jgi:hypothetical protein